MRGRVPKEDEPLAQRLARHRKERGFTQKELAAKTGLIQALISDYERGKLRLNSEMILRFATALEISTDELLQPAGPKPARKPSRRVPRRPPLSGAPSSAPRADGLAATAAA